MNVVFESGHARNVALFNHLVTACTSYGNKYNPAREQIKLEAIIELANQGKQAMDSHNDALARRRTAVAKRNLAFKTLNPLLTRVMLCLRASATNEAYDQIAQSMTNRLRGVRTKKLSVEPATQSLSAEVTAPKHISASHVSYDNKVNNLDVIIQFIKQMPEYMPNEQDLQIGSLISFRDNLLALNQEVNECNIALNDIRLLRNRVIYKKLLGMVDLSIDIKNYIRSVYGPRSEEVRLLSGIVLQGRRLDMAEEEEAPEANRQQDAGVQS